MSERKAGAGMRALSLRWFARRDRTAEPVPRGTLARIRLRPVDLDGCDGAAAHVGVPACRPPSEIDLRLRVSAGIGPAFPGEQVLRWTDGDTWGREPSKQA